MLEKIDPVKTAAWKKLQEHYARMKNIHMQDMFREDAERFSVFSTRFEEIFLDYSKNIINEDTMELLRELAGETKVGDAIGKMFSGDKINETEGRAVLHTALRNRSNTPVYVDGKDVMPGVNKVLSQMKTFSDRKSTRLNSSHIPLSRMPSSA